MPSANIYSLLGVSYDADETAVKRAYAALIKQYRPDSHPAEFAQIRAAYEEAVRRCRERQQWEAWEEEDSQQPEEEQPNAHQEADSWLSEAPATRPAETAAEPVAAAVVIIEEPHQAEAAPPAQQASEAPVTVTFADAGEAEPAAPPSRSIVALLAEFEEHAGEEGEAEMLERYQAHAAELAAMPLDRQMDYEQALCRWLLFEEHPSLLVFREANLRYGWVDNSAEIAREYGSHAAKRATAMQELAAIFAVLRDAHSPYLSLDGKAGPRSSWLAWHYRVTRAKQQAAKWKIECDNAGLPQFARRVVYAPSRALQVFWLDVAVGAFAGWIEWLPGEDGALGVLRAILLGVFVLFLPALVRRAFVLAAPWCMGVVARVTERRERIFSALPKWIGPGASWSKLLLIVGGVAGLLVTFSVAPTFALIGVGAMVMSVAAVLAYAVLAMAEAGAAGAAIRLARFPAWVMGLPEARRKTGNWRAALGLDRLSSFRRRASFGEVPWWVWIVATQIILAIARGMRN